MKLDLRIQGKLDLRIAIQWNEIVKEVRKPFTNLIQRLSAQELFNSGAGNCVDYSQAKKNV